MKDCPSSYKETNIPFFNQSGTLAHSNNNNNKMLVLATNNVNDKQLSEGGIILYLLFPADKSKFKDLLNKPQ